MFFKQSTFEYLLQTEYQILTLTVAEDPKHSLLDLLDGNFPEQLAPERPNPLGGASRLNLGAAGRLMPPTTSQFLNCWLSPVPPTISGMNRKQQTIFFVNPEFRCLISGSLLVSPVNPPTFGVQPLFFPFEAPAIPPCSAARWCHRPARASHSKCHTAGRWFQRWLPTSDLFKDGLIPQKTGKEKHQNDGLTKIVQKSTNFCQVSPHRN